MAEIKPAEISAILKKQLSGFESGASLEELLEKPEIILKIQRIWLDENEETYTKWLTSVNDDHERLKWYKCDF